MRNEKYYYCYSYPLKSFIMDNGEKYILKAVHNESKKMYWVFERNQKLDRLLTEWQSRRKD